MSVIFDESIAEGKEIRTARQGDQNAAEMHTDDVTADRENAANTKNAEPQYKGQRDSSQISSGYAEMMKAAAESLFSEAGKEALNYLHGRGLTDETIKKYKLGYAADGLYFEKARSVQPAILFAHDGGCDYYSARSLMGSYFTEPDQEKAERILYNPAALERKTPCFVVEGQLDALSILQAGGNAVAITGTNWKESLVPYLKGHNPASVLILYLDNDPTDEKGHREGPESQAGLAAYLDNLGIPYITAHFDFANYPGEMPLKDANDLLQADHAQFAADVRQLEAEAERKLKPDNVMDYIRNTMHGEIMEIVKDFGRGTGFANLDLRLGSLYSGLYFLGGLSAVGKTTFIWQMADQIAKQGYDVLFFSLEMSRLEMVSKSLSRYTAIMSGGPGITSTEIRSGKRGKIIEQAAEKYMNDVGDHISVIQGDFNFDVTNIGDTVDAYILQNHVRPVVFVDYLQILPAAVDPDTGRKTADIRQLTNENVLYLKRLSRKYQIPVIVTSALNRSNYLSPIDFESFRESSGIEYSADCVLGLQLEAINDPIFQEDKKTIEKRELIKKARRDNPRNIQLVILKNRWGRSETDCHFMYYPQFDYFEIPEEEMPDEKDLLTFHKISEGEQLDLPFN